MDFEAHCRASEEKFGDRFEDVNWWLDEMIADYAYSERYKHRKHRHHKEGIELARRLFGDRGAQAAELHIRMDNEGWLPSKEDYNIPEYD